jgi:hypothetical protein
MMARGVVSSAACGSPMADTAVAPNNRAVVYRGKAQRERPRMSGFGIDPTAAPEGGKGQRMPTVSQAQTRAMYAAKAGNSTLGISPSVGAEMTAELKPGQVKKMPKRVGSMHKRARISNKAKAKLDAKHEAGESARQEAREHRYGGKDQEPINAASR